MVQKCTNFIQFDIFNDVRSKGQVCDEVRLMNKIRNADLLPIYRQIADCADKDQQQLLKKQLPGVSWQAHFTNGRRINAEAEPSGLFMCDYDGVEEPRRVYEERIKPRLRELGIMVAHITPSLKGLRVVALCRKGLPTIEQNQQWLSDALGLQHDEACKDLARFSYLVPWDYFLWYDTTIWFKEPECLVEAGGRPAREPEAYKVLPAQTEYKGLKLRAIADKWLEQHGGVPEQGERNSKLYDLALRMRYICDFDPQTIVNNIPHCGLSHQEVFGLSQSACKTNRGEKMPKDLALAIAALKHASEPPRDPAGAEKDYSYEKYLLRMPRLPEALKASLKGVPDSAKMAVLCGVMPIIGAYASDVELRYCDGKRHRLNLMSIVVGEQASGKSAVKDAVNMWKQPMREADAALRAEEDAFKQRRKSRKANEKLPDEPCLPIREVPITISNTVLLKRMKNAQGKHLYSFGEELDTLRKTNAAGAWSAKYDVYRLGFDNGEWGQDFNSDQAESGIVKVAYNWTVLGTQGSVAKCFESDKVENGLSGRILFAQLPDNPYAYMPHYDTQCDGGSKEQQIIADTARYLAGCGGFVDTPKLRRAVERWCNGKADEARAKDDRVLDTYRKRAAAIGFRCGGAFQLMENGVEKRAASAEHHESQASIEFALLMAEFALENQIDLFGQQLLAAHALLSESGSRKTKNKALFDELPGQFTFAMLQQLKPNAKYNALRMMVSIWKNGGFIQSVDGVRNTWKKV